MSARCRVVPRAPYGTACGEQLAFYANGHRLDQGRYTLPAMREEKMWRWRAEKDDHGRVVNKSKQKNNNEDELEML